MYDIITNGTEIKTRIISEINNAQLSIYLAMAYFTDRDIAYSIISAKNRGISVDIILSSNAQNETVKQMFINENISLHSFETGDPRGMMHHKFCLIDGRISINGSYNYSYNASNNNVENIQVSDDIIIYNQLFAEFEKLRYKIDNKMDVNSNLTTEMAQENFQVDNNLNNADSFTTQLSNLVFTTANINTENYKIQGYENAEESAGNIEIFRSNVKEINEKIKLYATDDSLTGKKNTIIQHIVAAFENKKNEINAEKENHINRKISIYDLNIKHLKTKIEEHKKEKSVIELGSEIRGEKGLLQINTLIEKNKLEKIDLEATLPISSFWNPGTIISLFLLIVFSIYLLIFFSSAVYKTLIEENVIIDNITKGQGEMPSLINANALIEIGNSEGFMFAFLAGLFFLIPLLLSNLKHFVKNNNWVKYGGLIAGIAIFDIIVAFMVAKNTNHVRNLISGTNNELRFFEVLQQGEFWLIFIFGMIPLIICHFIIDFLVKAYHNSKSEYVDADKTRKINALNQKLLDLNLEKDILTKKIKDQEDMLIEKSNELDQLEKDLNTQINHINEKYLEIHKNIKNIYDEFIARLTSGRIFTDDIFKSVYNAYKTGFLEYLTELYSEKEVANRVRLIEQEINFNH